MAAREIKLDQYFTRVEDAKTYIDIIDKMYDMSSFDVIIEPSAGAGAFYNQLPVSTRIGLDLHPLSPGIIEQDFFTYEGPSPLEMKRTLTIGNPPFGRRGSLAKRFIASCAEYSDVIAFVLPAIFSKHTFINSMPEYFHLMYEETTSEFELPDGAPHPVKCVFQIWEKKQIKRPKIMHDKTHPDFDMIHRHIAWITDEEQQQLSKEYDFAYGQISGKIQEIKDLKKGSQFLIKAHVPGVRETFGRMDTEQYKQYSMGATSLSRADIINMYKKARNNP